MGLFLSSRRVFVYADDDKPFHLPPTPPLSLTLIDPFCMDLVSSLLLISLFLPASVPLSSPLPYLLVDFSFPTVVRP
jgi:hypothetical protein